MIRTLLANGAFVSLRPYGPYGCSYLMISFIPWARAQGCELSPLQRLRAMED